MEVPSSLLPLHSHARSILLLRRLLALRILVSFFLLSVPLFFVDIIFIYTSLLQVGAIIRPGEGDPLTERTNKDGVALTSLGQFLTHIPFDLRVGRMVAFGAIVGKYPKKEQMRDERRRKVVGGTEEGCEEPTRTAWYALWYISFLFLFLLP